MKKRIKKQGIGAYFFKMFIIFILIYGLMIGASNLIVQNSAFFKFGNDILIELFYGLLVLIVMLLFNNSYVFTDKKEKFSIGVKYGLPVLLVSIITFIINIVSLKSFSLGNFLNVIILCIFVGIAEEFLCRGWLQNEFIERYGDTKENVIKSIILSSLIFGIISSLNSYNGSLIITVFQIISSTAMGLLLGSIYYKTKNIWSVIFLHSFYAFATMIGQMEVIKECSYINPSVGVIIVESVSLIVISTLWILSMIYVINNSNFPNKRIQKRQNNSTLILCIVIVFVLSYVPYNSLIDDYDKYKVCYNYETIDELKNYTTHYLNYEKYYINSNIDEIEYTNSNDEIKEYVKTNNYKFEISYDFDTLIIRNLNTNYEKRIVFDSLIYGLQVIENNNNYMVIIHTLENDSTVYYSNFITKDGLSNEIEYLNLFERSLVKYEFPDLEQVGYITFSDNDKIYPFMRSVNNDNFILMDQQLYLIKK